MSDFNWFPSEVSAENWDKIQRPHDPDFIKDHVKKVRAFREQYKAKFKEAGKSLHGKSKNES